MYTNAQNTVNRKETTRNNLMKKSRLDALSFKRNPQPSRVIQVYMYKVGINNSEAKSNVQEERTAAKGYLSLALLCQKIHLAADLGTLCTYARTHVCMRDYIMYICGYHGNIERKREIEKEKQKRLKHPAESPKSPYFCRLCSLLSLVRNRCQFLYYSLITSIYFF